MTPSPVGCEASSFFLFLLLHPTHYRRRMLLSHLITHSGTHSRQDSPGRGIGTSQRPLSEQHTIFARVIHACGGIRTHNPSKRADADPRLRRCAHQERPRVYSPRENSSGCESNPFNPHLVLWKKWSTPPLPFTYVVF